MEWISTQDLSQKGEGILCCGQPCRNCVYPRAFSTKQVGGGESTHKGLQFKCEATCLVGMTRNGAEKETAILDYSVLISGAASKETCSLQIIEMGVPLNMSSNSHRSGLVWPLQCDSASTFSIWLHRNERIQYAVNGVVFHQSDKVPVSPLVRQSSTLKK